MTKEQSFNDLLKKCEITRSFYERNIIPFDCRSLLIEKKTQPYELFEYIIENKRQKQFVLPIAKFLYELN